VCLSEQTPIYQTKIKFLLLQLKKFSDIIPSIIFLGVNFINTIISEVVKKIRIYVSKKFFALLQGSFARMSISAFAPTVAITHSLILHADTSYLASHLSKCFLPTPSHSPKVIFSSKTEENFSVCNKNDDDKKCPL
jgi:hypothetical protein